MNLRAGFEEIVWFSYQRFISALYYLVLRQDDVMVKVCAGKIWLMLLFVQSERFERTIATVYH